MILRRLTSAEFTDIYHRHLAEDFPLSEQKPLELLQELAAAGSYGFYGFYDQEDLLAYAACCIDEQQRTAVLDYFAVCQQRRSSGLGGRCLSLLCQELRDSLRWIVLEADAVEYAADSEDEALCRRRLTFYHRNAARYTGLLTHSIGYHALVLSLDLAEAPTPAEARQTLLSCYRLFYGDEAVEREITFAEQPSPLGWPEAYTL